MKKEKKTDRRNRRSGRGKKKKISSRNIYFDESKWSGKNGSVNQGEGGEGRPQGQEKKKKKNSRRALEEKQKKRPIHFPLSF